MVIVLLQLLSSHKYQSTMVNVSLMYGTEISPNTTSSRTSKHHGNFFEQHMIAGWIGME
jgi:hypothetical protein